MDNRVRKLIGDLINAATAYRQVFIDIVSQSDLPRSELDHMLFQISKLTLSIDEGKRLLAVDDRKKKNRK